MKRMFLLAVIALLAACSKGGNAPSTMAQTATGPNGQTVQVTIDRIIDPTSDIEGMDEQSRYVAVVLTVTNTSDEPFTETRPDSDSGLTTSTQPDLITADLHEVSDCAPFAKDQTEVAPGDSISGCVTFEVAADSTLATFIYYFGETLTFDLT